MYYVYILVSEKMPDKVYVGFTTNLTKRLQEHNGGLSTYTKSFKPWKMVCAIRFTESEQAEKFERYLKKGSGFAFMKKHLLPKVPTKLLAK
mgnify:CR=1 FL=1